MSQYMLLKITSMVLISSRSSETAFSCIHCTVTQGCRFSALLAAPLYKRCRGNRLRVAKKSFDFDALHNIALDIFDLHFFSLLFVVGWQFPELDSQLQAALRIRLRVFFNVVLKSITLRREQFLRFGWSTVFTRKPTRCRIGMSHMAEIAPDEPVASYTHRQTNMRMPTITCQNNSYNNSLHGIHRSKVAGWSNCAMHRSAQASTQP